LHLLRAMTVLGLPNTVKTDNGPAYASGALHRFFNDWGIKHVMGIPHSPMGQAIVEQAHGS
ncbi:POK6 protein, partial [Oxyruncus cristatus]|nr:POK6 protein [Oxyruncus cristatus]